MASFIDSLKSLGSRLSSLFGSSLNYFAEGASRSIASFGERLERNSVQVKKQRGWLPRDGGGRGQGREQRHLTGERAFSQMMRGTGGIGWPGSWTSDRARQVQFFRRWVHIAIDRIGSKVASLPPRVALVHPAGEHQIGQSVTKSSKLQKRARTRRQRQRLKARRIHKRMLLEARYRKTLHAIKPHEEVEDVGPDHPLVRLLAKPNAWDRSPGQLWYEIVLFLLLTGNAYLWVVPAKLGGKPLELWVIPSQFVWGPKLGPAGPEYYEIIPYVGGIGSFRIPAEEIIHFSFKNPLNKIDGFAPLQAGAEWVDVSESIDQSRYWAFKNGTQASGAIELGPKYDPDDIDIDAIGAKFLSRYQGERNAGTPFILPPDAKMVPLTIAPVDLAFQEGFSDMRDAILALFGVPKEVAGIQDAGSEIAMYGPMKQFMEHAINPRLRYIGEVLTAALASRWDDHLRIWWDDGTPPDPQQVNADINTDAQHGAITINQICAIRGREPFDDPLADEPLVNPNLIPLSMLKKKLEQAQQAPPGMPGAPGGGGNPFGKPGPEQKEEDKPPVPLAQRVRDNEDDNEDEAQNKDDESGGDDGRWMPPQKPLPPWKQKAFPNGNGHATATAVLPSVIQERMQRPAEERNLLRDFPDIRQPNHYACGASASCAVGRWYVVGPKNVASWERVLGTTVEQSTHPYAIVNYFRQLGCTVEARDGMTIDDLAAHTERGTPVIVCVQDWGTRREEGASFAYGHYLVVLGVHDGMVMCQDSSVENAAHEPGGDVPKSQAEPSGNIAAPGRVMIDAETFEKVWHDEDAAGNPFVRFGIAVGPPAGWREKGKQPPKVKTWDEEKHPRDHGKFSSKPGSKGGEKDDSKKSPSVDPNASTNLDSQQAAETSHSASRPTHEHYLNRQREVVESEPRSEVVEKLRTTPVTAQHPLGGGANGSHIIALEGGAKAVWKPASEENPGWNRKGIPAGSQYKREAATYALAEAIGFADLVPPTTIREVDGKEGSAQHYEAKATTACKVVDGKLLFQLTGIKKKKQTTKYDGEDDLKRAAVFDYLLSSSDRHDGNWMLTNDKRLKLIDNGACLPTNYDDKEGLANRMLLEEAQSRGYVIPKEMAALADKWSAMEKAMKSHGIEDEAITLAKERLDILVKAAQAGKKFSELPGVYDFRKAILARQKTNLQEQGA